MEEKCAAKLTVIPEYTFSMNGIGAAVVGERIETPLGFDFQFNPIIAGAGVNISQPVIPGPITITAGAGATATLQSAYDNGQTINMTSGPIQISGNDIVQFNNTDGILINNGLEHYLYNNNIGVFGNGATLLDWPDINFPGNTSYSATNSIVYFEFIFIGFETATGISFTVNINGIFDQGNSLLKFNKLSTNIVAADITPSLSPLLRFTLNVNSGILYDVAWSIQIHLRNR